MKDDTMIHLLTAKAAVTGGFRWNPSLASLAVITLTGLISFALVKWGNMPWWGLFLGILSGVLLAATHFLGPQVMSILGSWTNGNLGR